MPLLITAHRRTGSATLCWNCLRLLDALGVTHFYAFAPTSIQNYEPDQERDSLLERLPDALGVNTDSCFAPSDGTLVASAEILHRRTRSVASYWSACARRMHSGWEAYLLSELVPRTLTQKCTAWCADWNARGCAAASPSAPGDPIPAILSRQIVNVGQELLRNGGQRHTCPLL